MTEKKQLSASYDYYFNVQVVKRETGWRARLAMLRFYVRYPSEAYYSIRYWLNPDWTD